MSLRSLAIAGLCVVSLGSASCGPPPSAAAVVAPPPEEIGDLRASPHPPAGTETFEAVVKIVGADPARQGKQFIGVMLERDDGSQWVVTYGQDRLWAVFAERRVEVVGKRFQPEGQALLATHFRPETWRIKEPGSRDRLLEVGPERVLRGVFEESSFPEGSKLAGEKHLQFVDTAGARYELESAPGDVPRARSVEIRARRVVPSMSYAARVGGEYLWILEVTPR